VLGYSDAVLLFTEDAVPLIRSGQLTVTWRLWKYAHVKTGKVYRTGFGGAVQIDDVRTVRVGDVTDADAAEAGFGDAQALVEFARSHTGAVVTPDTLLYCVRFHHVDEEPKKPELSLDEVTKRLDRLDRASTHGPWTLATLRAIEASPAVVARLLAADLDRPRDEFKVDVRKLKALGLTVSLERGYLLSELGQTWLDRHADD
jgi:hypothetical protein